MDASLERLRHPTRSRILDAAEAHFSDVGYEAARVDDIAAAAGLSKSNLYFHFPAKADLLAGLVRLRCAELLAAKADVLDGLDLAAVLADEEALARMLRHVIETVLVPQRRFIRVVLVEAIRNPEAVAPVFAMLQTVLDDSAARFATVGIDVAGPEARTLLFQLGLVPALFAVALDGDVTGSPDGYETLVAGLARLETTLLALRRST